MDTWPVPQMEEICNKASSLSSIMEYIGEHKRDVDRGSLCEKFGTAA